MAETYPTGRIEPEVMNTIPPEQAKWIFAFRRDDIQARLTLIDCAEELQDAGFHRGAATFDNAEKYLTDRAEYQRHFLEEPR